MATVDHPLAEKVKPTALKTSDLVEFFRLLVQDHISILQEVVVVNDLDLLSVREVCPDEYHHLLALLVFPGLFVHQCLFGKARIN